MRIYFCYKDLWYNIARNVNIHDEVKDVLVLSFIHQAIDKMVVCNVAKATSFKEVWKVVEEEFGARGSDMKQQVMS